MDVYSEFNYKNVEEERLESCRQKFIIKSNDLVFYGKYNYSFREMRLLLILMSNVKKGDTTEYEYFMTFSDISKICNAKQNYSSIKEIILGINRPFQVAEKKYTWFDYIFYIKSGGVAAITYKYNAEISPFIFDIKTKKTSYPIKYILPMKSVYSIRLYEILKSHKKETLNMIYLRCEVDELKELLNDAAYKRWVHFKQRVLDPALLEINNYSDLEVTYKTEKQGNVIKYIVFDVRRLGRQQ